MEVAAPPPPPPRCYPVREAVSNGVLQGDDPTQFALPLLVIQIALVLVTTRTLAFLIKPLHQPRVLAEVIGGVLLGPSGLGHSKLYLHSLFPPPSLATIDTIATLGLLFFLFMVGLELDLAEIRRSGRAAVLAALSGVALPFSAAFGLAALFHRSISASSHHHSHPSFAALVVFMGVPISITAFPVLVRIMAERKLLGTELGRIVLPAAAINDVCAWIMLALGVALAAGGGSSPATPAYVLLCGIAYVAFMLLVVRRVMEKVAEQAQSAGGASEMCVCLTLVAVLVAGFTTDAIGIHPLFGAFVFGLVVPKDGGFAQMLTEKIEDFVTVLMLPLFFASSGLKTNLGSINSAKAVALLLLVVVTASVGKISATVAAGLLLKFDLRKSFAFGFLMNTKGLVELIVLNIGKDIGVFDDQTFAILVMTCLIILFFTTPAVMALYEPARTPLPYVHRKLDGKVKEVAARVLVCVHGSRGIPALLNLLEACTYYKGGGGATAAKGILGKAAAAARPALKLYAMRLVELSNRSSAIMSLSRAQALADGRRESGDEGDGDDSSCDSGVLMAFKAYGRFAKVPVKLMTAVSELCDMHEDVCKEAAARRANIIVLPYLYRCREDGGIESADQGWRAMYGRVLKQAPCSVAVVVDRGRWGQTELKGGGKEEATTVAVLFFGGGDDREAVALGVRMAGHASVRVVVVRFVLVGGGGGGAAAAAAAERLMDEKCIEDIKKEEGLIVYEEEEYCEPSNVIDKARRSDFGLLVFGLANPFLAHLHCPSDHHLHHLGFLAHSLSSSPDFSPSFIVVQQHSPPPSSPPPSTII